MITIPYKFLSYNKEAPERGYWDMYMIEKYINDRPDMFVPAKYHKFQMVIVAGRQNPQYYKEIQEYISKLNGVLLIITGDEETKFPSHKLKHKNMKLWVMTPSAGREYPNVDRFIGSGISPHCELIQENVPNKNLKWFFSGQITHSRRFTCANELERYGGGKLIRTKGFTQGLSQEEYIETLTKSKIVPCPSGAVVPDSFRLFEALEAGAIPIADGISSINKTEGYWNMIFGDDIEFPIINNWRAVGGVIDYMNDVFEKKSNEVFAWWQLYKRNFRNWIIDDFYQITGEMKIDDSLTVIVPTSPIESHPDTSIIEETISTIRHQLPNAEIIITFDGIRDEQKERTQAYHEYVRRILWKANREWKNVLPVVMKEFNHQVGMMRHILPLVRTDNIVYIEHDTPLVTDYDIPFKKLSTIINDGVANTIRLHFESKIPQEHMSLMLDRKPIKIGDIPMIRTIQWSQRPHISSLSYYKRILTENFSKDAKTFIEDKMHSVVQVDYRKQQMQGWNKHKLFIYHPNDNIKRSYNLDGRGSERKYNLVF